MSLCQSLQEETAEPVTEDLDRQKKLAAALDPLVVVGGQAAAGNDAVQVGMKVKVLAPGMEHGKEADFHAQMFGVAGNGEQGFRRGAEENVVDDVFVVEG